MKGNISIKDGSIILKNKEISMEAYDIIEQRTILHEATAKYNCLMKEYVNELQKSDRDIEHIESLKNDIEKVDFKLNIRKLEFEQSYNMLKGQPELMKEFTKHHQEHLLNVDTCCPQNTYELKEYLEQKISFLEGKLEDNEKQQLNIQSLASKQQQVNIKEDIQIENKLTQMYDNYSAVDPYGIVERELVFAPSHLAKEQQLLKEKQFCCLKGKDDLMTLQLNTSDELIKDHCSSKINEVDKDINKYIEAINNSEKIIGKINHPLYDNKNKYLLYKTKLTTFDERENFKAIAENKEMENQVEVINKGIMEKVEAKLKTPNIKETTVDIDLQKAYNINKFCNISNEIEKLEQTSEVIDYNTKEIQIINNKLQKKEETLAKAAEHLGTIEKHQEIADKYENKKVFKKSYQKKHQNIKDIYDKAQDELKKIGITNSKQYHLEKEKFEKLKPQIEKDKKILQLSTPSRMEIIKKLTPLKKEQANIMKNVNTINKTKVVTKKLNSGLER